MGPNELRMILECRRAEHAGEIITDDLAQEIASLFHSPSRHDRGITALSHSGKRLASLRSEIEREIRKSHYTATDRLLLRAVLAWIAANPIEVLRYEHVVFLDGDSADEILRMIYPEWSHGSASTGFPDGADDALIYVKGWDYGEPTDEPDSYEDPAAGYGTDSVRDDSHVLAWNFGLGWVSLSRIEREVG